MSANRNRPSVWVSATRCSSTTTTVAPATAWPSGSATRPDNVLPASSDARSASAPNVTQHTLGGPGSQLTVRRGAWQVVSARSVLVELERELELHQRGVDGADRLHAVATEVMRGALQMQPGGLERADRGHDLRVWLPSDVGDRTGRFRRWRGGTEWQGEDGGEHGNGDNARECSGHVASF